MVHVIFVCPIFFLLALFECVRKVGLSAGSLVYQFQHLNPFNLTTVCLLFCGLIDQ